MKHQRTRILPLRWIANFSSSIATNSLVKAFDLQEDNNLGYRFKFHSKVWHYFNKPYERWGTYYTINMDGWREELSGQGWDDKDEDGVAYWEKYTDGESQDS